MKALLTSILLFSFFFGSAQKQPFRVADNEMILTLDRRWSSVEIDEVLLRFDMKSIQPDSAFQFLSPGKLGAEGWKVRRKSKHVIEVFKPLENNPAVDIMGIPVCIDASDSLYSGGDGRHEFTRDVFGYNAFKVPSVVEIEDGLTEFRLSTRSSVKEVFLSGTFNNWSTSSLPMVRAGDYWMARVKLNSGRHEYKYIIDGEWKFDPRNELRLDDGYSGYNSVYFKRNHVFRLKGYTDAKRVVLSGSFNDWNESDILLKRDGQDWSLDVFLPDGTYFYKFIVDGEWITDPANPEIKPDAFGNLNSYLSFGKQTVFELRNFPDAGQVILSGSFNNWDEHSLTMTKNEQGIWSGSFAIPPGNYAYKFIVDGKWIYDNNSPTVPNEFENDKNNLLVIEPNHVFTLKGYDRANSVYVTGSFNDWFEPGYPLVRVNDVWQLPLFLKRGKVLYKFVVDGSYILDPGNALFEENEFGTGNSFIWIE